MSKFLFILQFDSFIKTLIPVIDRLEGQNQIDIFLLQIWKKKDWIDSNIKSLMGDHSFKSGGFKQLTKLLLNDYDVIVLGSVGGRLNVHLSSFLQKSDLTSHMASGYVGALLQNNPTGFLKGVMRRAFTDLIWTPGTESYFRILNTGMINQERTQVLATGLPRFDALYRDSRDWIFRRETILFIEQPTFPESRAERMDLVQHLVAIARAYPNQKVVIKPRFLELTGHAHRPKYLLPDLLEHIEDLPENILVSKENLAHEFQQASFALSISSTGALEALLLGIPTYFIRDYCGDSNRYGSLDFLEMGNVIHFHRVIEHRLPQIDFEKAKSFLRFDGRNTQRLVDALQQLANQPRKPRLPDPVKLVFEHPKDGDIFKGLRQRLKHTHDRHPALIAAWMNPSIKVIQSKSQSDLIIKLSPKVIHHSEAQAAVSAVDQIGIHVFVAMGRILAIYPQKYDDEGLPTPWRTTDLNRFCQEQELLILQEEILTQHPHILKGLLELKNHWGELRFFRNKDSFTSKESALGITLPAIQLSAELANELRTRREPLEGNLKPIYYILDEVAWYDRLFAVLVQSVVEKKN